jgi:putative transposase
MVARDGLWEIVEPLVPTAEAASTGRPRVPDRTAFGAIVFVLFTGCAWKQIPRELGCSGSTAHDRFTSWTKAGGL